MDIQEISDAISSLESAINEFPKGAVTVSDYKSLEEKIEDLRNSLKWLNAKAITLQARVEYGKDDEIPADSEKHTALANLNTKTTNFLINSRATSYASCSRAVQDILNCQDQNNGATLDMQLKAKEYLKLLYFLNENLNAENERQKELRKKEEQLKLSCHDAMYKIQELAQKKEAEQIKKQKNKDPNIQRNKDKVIKDIAKINLQKKLITNLIAAMYKNLGDHKELIELLQKHKNIFDLETIIEITHDSSFSSRASS